MFQDLVETDIYYGAIFENSNRLEFNKNLFKDYPNKLCEFIPEFDKELYDMLKFLNSMKISLNFIMTCKMMKVFVF